MLDDALKCYLRTKLKLACHTYSNVDGSICRYIELLLDGETISTIDLPSIENNAYRVSQ